MKTDDYFKEHEDSAGEAYYAPIKRAVRVKAGYSLLRDVAQEDGWKVFNGFNPAPGFLTDEEFQQKYEPIETTQEIEGRLNDETKKHNLGEGERGTFRYIPQKDDKLKRYIIVQEDVDLDFVPGQTVPIPAGDIVIEDPEAARTYVDDPEYIFDGHRPLTPDQFEYYFIVQDPATVGPVAAPVMGGGVGPQSGGPAP